MNVGVKTLLRTVQINFPFLLDAKFAAMRRYRKARRIPFDRDFDGIGVFPVDKGALFLDVGANRGQSTDAILMMRADSRIQMFEPNPLLCEKLRRQFGQDDRVVINEFGLGNGTSELPLHVPFYKSWMFDGLASFDRQAAKGWLEGRVLFYRDEHLSVREVMCRIRPLDDLRLAPFFIKIDVQGYEFDVLKGGEKTIRTHEPVLLIESPPEEEIIRFLREIGYSFYTFRNGRFTRGVAESNNTFFMTERRASLVRAHIVA